MTTRDELLEILEHGENSVVEFKRDDLDPQDLAKELVAFSNLQGGMVILGVEDDGMVSGLTRPHTELEEWVMNVCRDKIRPAIVPFFTVMRNFEGDKDIAIVRVSRGYSAHALRHDNTERYLLRFGTRSLDPRQEELDGLSQRQRATRIDVLPVSGTTIKHMDRMRLRNYLQEIRGIELPEDEDELLALLSYAGFMADGCVSVFGLLLLGEAPDQFLPHAGIHAVAYSGTGKEDHVAKEKAALRGPMAPLLDAKGDLVEAGLVEQALEFVRRNTLVSAALEDGGRWVERPTYPDAVVREAVVNALVHRDYAIADKKVELSIYSDRLEITSPGGLLRRVTLDGMRLGVQFMRNESLQVAIQEYHLKGIRSGVPRIIIKGMKEHNGTEPDLIEQHERFTVRLFAKAPGGESDAWPEEKRRRATAHPAAGQPMTASAGGYST